MKLSKGILLILTHELKYSLVEINSGSIPYYEMNFDGLDIPFSQNTFVPKNE